MDAHSAIFVTQLVKIQNDIKSAVLLFHQASIVFAKHDSVHYSPCTDIFPHLSQIQICQICPALF